MGDFWSLDDAVEPKIHGHYAGLEDAPEKHRWRATWQRDWKAGFNIPTGILLTPYPVVSLTNKGAWIDPYAYHHGAWEFSGEKRFVMNGSGSSWAKLTQQEALHSIAYRLIRWAQKTRHEMQSVDAAIAVAEALLPDCAGNVAKAKQEWATL